MEITVNAPAKINLYLDILNKRNDGYHEVEMIMQTVSLFDKITIKKSDKKGIKVTSTYNFDEDIKKNTAYIAAEKLRFQTKEVNISIIFSGGPPQLNLCSCSFTPFLFSTVITVYRNNLFHHLA